MDVREFAKILSSLEVGDEYELTRFHRRSIGVSIRELGKYLPKDSKFETSDVLENGSVKFRREK